MSSLLAVRTTLPLRIRAGTELEVKETTKRLSTVSAHQNSNNHQTVYRLLTYQTSIITFKKERRPGGGGVVLLPYNGLMGTCDQPGHVLRDFCLKQGIDFIIFCLRKSIFSLAINSLRVFSTN